MAGYYINGLLNTETAWDSYCIYGYKSDIDKRYFCAVQTSDIFYASNRESAYINVYIYCKGQQVSTLKCISNKGSEYDVSTSHYSTVDPTVTRVYEHPVWSNMNGRQVTMADFLSNAPILYGVNLSDAERDALAINYLNNVPEPYGQGTVTLTIKRPGQTLNFASRLLSKTISQYIDSDAVVNMEDSVVEKYSIEGLLNTETAYDSYCTYGYRIDADSRLFCAVKVYGLFYASIRESAYIRIYLYYKGTDTPSIKCIDNTGAEFSVSGSHMATSDPNIFRILDSGSVWTNQNGRSATMADIISNAPILEGNNLSDSERDALAINYLNGLT